MVACALLLLLLPLLAQADPPRCQEPEAFMAKFFLLDPDMGQYKNKSNFYVGRGRSAYDVRGNRQRIQEDVHHPDNEVTIDLLQLVNDMVIYVVSTNSTDTTKVCKKYTMKQDPSKPKAHLQPLAVPDKANYTGSEYIGSASDGVEVTEWRSQDSWGGVAQTHWLRYTAQTCLPVSSHVTNKETGWKLQEWSDVVLGIGDPTIFDPPTMDCEPAGDVWVGGGLGMGVL